MLKLPQQTIVKWSIKNKEHFISKGYPFTRIKDSFSVDVLDLNKGSKSLIIYICDYCQEEKEIEYKVYLRKIEKSHIKKDSCSNCQSKKMQETQLYLYGVKNPMQRQEITQKVKNTNKNKYGFEYPSQVPEIKEKIIETNLIKYGTEHPMQSEIVKEKTKNTNLEKYGFSSHMKVEDIKNKVIKTNTEKYGGMGRGSVEISKKIDNAMIEKYGIKTMVQDEKVREKAIKELKKNKKHKSSKQQEFIHSLIGGEVNYPVGRYSLDIAFPEDKIYIEFDGSGHDLPVRMGKMTKEDFLEKENKRSQILYSKGWKEIRLISYNDKLPSAELLIELISRKINQIKDIGTIKRIKIDFNKIEGLELYRIKGDVS